MPSVRPFVAASVALVGASVIAVSPVTPAQSELRTVGLDVNLVAATTSDFLRGRRRQAVRGSRIRAGFHPNRRRRRRGRDES